MNGYINLIVKALWAFSLMCISFRSVVAQTIGSKVSFTAADGKTYTGMVNDVRGSQFKIKYDGFDFEAWLTKEQFTLINTIAPPYTLPNATKTTVQTLENIFAYGKQRGWVSQVQERIFNAYINQFSIEEKRRTAAYFCQATTFAARFFALKSVLSGDSYELIQTFIEELNQYPESYQLEHCLATNRRSIIQQWELSCSVTTIQTYLADLCPRYAWEVKKIKDFDVVANDPNHPMAVQQKQLLEKYGGVASLRGDFSGKSIGIIGPINEYVGRILGVTFRAKPITEPLPSVFGNIRNMLDRGINVPLLIGFVGIQSKHFILVMKYQKTASSYQYLIYDPWDGLCDYVSESAILQGSLAPLLTRWKIAIDYYYTTD